MKAGKMGFRVSDQRLEIDAALLNASSFLVQSIPRPYRVTWEDNLSPSDTIKKVLGENTESVLFADEKIYELYFKGLEIKPAKVLTAHASEEFKTLDGVVRLVDFLQRNDVTKGDQLIVVGGGIIQDVGAFAGACYKRGIPWTYIPTTLLSMCDSCIGGKTGINHGNAKNQLALFSAPYKVVINPAFINTLDEKAIRSGLGEILKLHITGGEHFIEEYKKLVSKGCVNSPESYKKLIIGSLLIKKAIVELDEFEMNLRRSLNYGHTVGHCIEPMTDYRISHGEAVSIGMLLVNELAVSRSILDAGENGEIKELILDILDKDTIKEIRKLDASNLRSLLKKDKKTKGNKVNFVILRSAGFLDFLSIPLEESLIKELKDLIKASF
jgi:3-dehydroquinate synthase